MSRFVAAGALAALAAVAVAPSVSAQQPPPPPLAYVQPLAPPALRAVQQALHSAGVYGGAVDGAWGQDSEAALQQFQQTHSLQVTGQMNPATAQALGLDPDRLLQIAPPQPQPPPIRLSADAIRNIQARLRQMGYYQGGLDGEFGPEMGSAIARLQQNRGLQPTGRLDPQTVTAMGLDPNNPGAPAP
jgi:peptidoglycan hydrolase-like protein with peptidoglycan-binding domain